MISLEHRDTVNLRAYDEGFCCAYAFWYMHGLRGQDNLPITQAKQLAARLQYNVRTIYKWHGLIRDGKLKPCDLCPGPGHGFP